MAKCPVFAGDANDECPSKRPCLFLYNEVDMTWVQDEINDVRESLERIATEAREDREEINSILQKLLDEVQQKT